MNSLTIRVYESSEEGYGYDIFDHDLTECADQECERVDGGLCTTTLLNALGMAHSQAEALIRREAELDARDARMIGTLMGEIDKLS